VQLQAFFSWLLRKNQIPSNPASDLELPGLPRRLPLTILSPGEIESILKAPDIATPAGLRDKALLELLYSTGIRRKEVAELNITSIDWHRSALKICQGKGGKDRVIPIGQRALHWLRLYLDQARPAMIPKDSSRLFLNNQGGHFNLNGLGNLVHRYVTQVGGVSSGSCHVFRHAMATAMLDNGADIRFVQEMLGHQRLGTTQLYTHVSIEKLKTVHRTTHPAERDWAGNAPAKESPISMQPGRAAVSTEIIVSIRRSLALNTTEFAGLLNTPVSSLVRLERGQTQAKGPLLRLLQILLLDPSLARKIH
jgi:integrase/recombinase XerD